MTWYLIPCIGIPQTFTIALLGINYIFTVKWNDAEDAGWQFDLSNADTGDSLVAGSPLITGANCLEGLEYLGIGGIFFVSTNGDENAIPTYTNLGSDCNLYFVVNNG